MIRAAAVLAALVVLIAASTASAEVVRFAMVIGANRGLAGEESLRYAVDDATKVARVLGELGGVPAEHMTVLADRDAESVRRALIVLNERIRARRTAGAEIVLYVYYSGHADAHALHLGGTTLELAELEGLVRGSAADLRLLVLDACRSGALTRVKGGRPAPPVAIALDDRLRGEGLAILSSSSGSEDAQESDDLRGSFFTHYLVSALLGAGDDEADVRRERHAGAPRHVAQAREHDVPAAAQLEAEARVLLAGERAARREQGAIVRGPVRLTQRDVPAEHRLRRLARRRRRGGRRGRRA